MRRYVVEFVGTFLLVVVIGAVVLAESPQAPLAIGAAVAALVYTGYHISGGQYNPVVTLAAFVRGVLPVREIAPYCAAQLLGGGLGAVVASLLVPDGARPGVALSGDAIATTVVGELVFTFALIWVVLHTATVASTSGNSYYALAIAAMVVAGILAVGLYGGVVNPVVAISLAIMGVLSWSTVWVWVLAEIAAAVLAARLFVYTNRPAAVSQEQAPAVERV
ncbi:MAG: aquaporin [Pseudonocardia sp.]